MQWVAERRYDYLSVYAPSRVIKIWFDMFRAAAAACGYTPPEEKIGLLLPIYVAQSDQRAQRGATASRVVVPSRLENHAGTLFPAGLPQRRIISRASIVRHEAVSSAFLR